LTFSHVKKSRLLTGWITGLLVLFLNGPVDGAVQSGYYILKSRDLRTFRRLILTNPTHRDSAAFVIPRLTTNYAEGTFTITLTPVDTNLYYGARLIRDNESQPLELTVSFPDSATIIITGRSDKLGLVADYFAISSNKFIFDLYRTRPEADDLRSDALSLFIMDNFDTGQPSGGDLPAVATSQTWLTPRLLLAFKIAGLFLLLFIIVQILRSNRKGSGITLRASPEAPSEKPTSTVQSPPPPADTDPVWTLAQENGISYDEALILMNVNRKKIDVRT
jgi:hypothetical protein